MNRAALAEFVGPRGFDDQAAAALFKLALVEAYCCDKISGHEVEQIFAETPGLKEA